MVFSMTGFGSSRTTRDGFDLTVQIRCLNHRFSNLHVRMPRGFADLENDVREIAVKRVPRGKVDIFIEIYSLPQQAQEITVNRGIVARLLELGTTLSETHHLPMDLTVESVLKFPDVFVVTPNDDFRQHLWDVVKETLLSALDALDEARLGEGRRLAEEMLLISREIGEELRHVKSLSHDNIQAVRTRIQENLEKILTDVTVNSERLEQEVAVSAMRLDITEEITRLKGHLSSFEQLMARSGAVGKRAEFLVQEMHREVNTIGSKSQVLVLTERVVNMKVSVEKIREQIQNLM